MKKMMRYIVVLIILLSWSLHSFSQQPSFKNYSVNDGLPSSQVYDMAQDAKGYMWFATDRGLCKYNGYTFESYTTQDGLTNNSVLRFYHHIDGTIWGITLGNQLFYIDSNGKFESYKYNHKIYEIVQDNTIAEILIHEGILYIGFINAVGYIQIDETGRIKDLTTGKEHVEIISEKIGGHQISYKISKEKRDSRIFKNSKRYRLKLKEGAAFFGVASINNTGFISSNHELYLIKNDSNKLIQIDKEPIGIGVYDSLHFWVGFRYGGVSIYDLNGNITRHYLTEKSVTRTFTDHERGVWFSSLNSGIFYLKNNSILLHEYNSNKNSPVHSLTSNKKKELYVGYYNGLACKWNENELKLVHKSILKRPVKVQFYKDLDEVIIYSDYKILGNKTHTIYNKLAIISLSDEENSPLAYSAWRFFYTEDSKFNIGKRGQDICISPYDTIVSSVDGIFRYTNSKLKRVNDNPLFRNRVDDIDYHNGWYYAASLGAGVIVFNHDTSYNIGVKNGLYSNITTEILAENDSVVWVCTNKGLNRINFNKDYSFSIEGISNEDGLLSNEVVDIEIIDNKVWVATVKGLCSFNKEILDKKDAISSNYFLSLKQAYVSDKPINIDKLKHLSYKENRIKIDYQAISFKNKELFYRYKLKGLEQKWNFTKGLNLIYPSLHAGEYQLILQVRGKNGKWKNNELIIPIFISPAFYTTWWFYGLIIFLSASIIYLFFKYNILSYNRDIIRELLRKLLKFLNRKDIHYLFIKEKGREIKIKTSDILFVKSSRNYIEIHTSKSKYVVREKISNFSKLVPDSIEFLRVHRSYIIRLDKVDKEDNQFVYINEYKIPLGESYKEVFKKILIS